MLLLSFFAGTSTVFFETAASALFLAHYDAAFLPYVYLLAALVSIVAGPGYNRAGEAGGLIFTMMIAYRLLSMLTDLEYWAVAARLYDVRQSKRLFGLVGSGEVAARGVGAVSVSAPV